MRSLHETFRPVTTTMTARSLGSAIAARAPSRGQRGAAARSGLLGLTGLLLAALATGLVGCAASPGDDGQSERIDPSAIGQISQKLCNPMNGGGDLGCGCTLNSQCSGFDDDTRLLVCDVPSGMTVGACLDCTTKTARPVGCACATTADCAMGAACNGRTCQALRSRGEFCVRNGDCGTDMLGAMTCLPTKSWCGPLEDDYPCDFNSDCISGVCSLGVCTSAGKGTRCGTDAGCKAPLVCSGITFVCIDKLADGELCARNVECQNQCNSFSGRCTLGTSGTVCTKGNPDGDCAPGLSCTDCGGAYTCRTPGGPCG